MKRFAAAILMVFFLVGVIGLKYDAHYCGGELVSENLSFIPKDLSCGMKGMDQDRSDDDLSFGKHCCDNKHLSFQIDDDYNDYQVQDFGTNVIAVIPPAALELSIVEFSNVDYNFIGYSPPPIERDIIVLNQTFLI